MDEKGHKNCAWHENGAQGRLCNDQMDPEGFDLVHLNKYFCGCII